MKANIKFVRKYSLGINTVYEAVYESGRVFAYYNEHISKPVKRFMESKIPKKQHDILHGEEYIYS